MMGIVPPITWSNIIDDRANLIIQDNQIIKQPEQYVNQGYYHVRNGNLPIYTLNSYFDPQYFFIKISPINTNEYSIKNKLGKGVIEGRNLI
jgi:hypothetical protein